MRLAGINAPPRLSCRQPRAALALALAAVAALLAASQVQHLAAQERPAAAQSADGRAAERDFGKLFDAVVERTLKSFWDKDLIAATGWEKRAAEVRQSVVDAPGRTEAVARINALLAELKTSHTGLVTPDEPEYYILLDVFSRGRAIRAFVAERFWGGGVRYAGAGFFTVRIGGRDFVDAVLEGSPADAAGLKAGDEIVSVDGAPYHPIRSFRGKVGRTAAIERRTSEQAPVERLEVGVVNISPVEAFSDATEASVRVIERGGKRIGYVHVWASVGDKSADALREALEELTSPPGNGEDDQSGRRRRNSVPAVPLDGVIVDMRGKIGGTGHNAGRYLDIIDPRGPFMRSRNKDAKNRPSLRGRTAVLIDHHTRSTGELFVHAYKRERQGPLIGTRTAGAVSAAGAYLMPGGDLLYLAVTGLEIDGEILEGPGVAPDIEVVRPIPYANGADPVVDAAVDYFVRGGAMPAPASPAVPKGSG